MSDQLIDPLTDRYVLEGRVVTMAPRGVIEDGAVFIEAGRIAAVQDAAAPPPTAFVGAPHIRTGDTLYPGMIELHNHLSYNALPLWDVPRKYAHNGSWRGTDAYRRAISKPAQVLGRSPGLIEALIRFVECRCLLGGATTSQGITLHGVGTREFYQGIVRNVESTDDPTLPEAGTKIGNPKRGGAADYLARLQNHTCYLQHLSEGVGDTPRGWFLNLQLDDGDWAIDDSFCGIHSTALAAEDFRAVSERGGSMVWSPLSNFLLYGQTADIRAAKDAGILIGLGCDWAPSGSKNLLGELKVAWLASEEQGGVFSPKELVQMTTVNPAEILKWQEELGTIEAGKRADLIAVNGRQGDEYMGLIEARETSITLVVIDGVPRVGQRRLMSRFQPGAEEMEAIKVGPSHRLLHLQEPASHELMRNLSLTEAVDRLREGMRNLPALARQLDETTDAGLFGGSVDGQGQQWRILFDFEEEDDALELLFAGETSFADFVDEALELEGLTVADDPGFLRKLVAARNPPEFVKKGLPPLYGQTIPLPDSAEFLRHAPEPVHPLILSTTQDLKTFLRTSGQLTLAQRKLIVDQALVLLEQNYVHLPLKRAMHAVDPIQRLRLLRYRLEDQSPETLQQEIEFHNEMTSIFNSLRDLHATYRLPWPYRDKTAWLPFLVEAFWEHGQRKFMVSKLVGDAGSPSFHPGVELLYWNGTPIERVVAQNAERQAGSNRAASFARGLNTLTIRPLVNSPPPEEEWVTVRYRDRDDPDLIHEWTQEWLLFEPARAEGSIDLTGAELPGAAMAMGLDAHTDDVQEAKKYLFAGQVVQEQETQAARSEPEPVANATDGVPSFMPTVFRARPVTVGEGDAEIQFGYIRIFTFNVSDSDAFVEEFVRLTARMPPGGVVIDVRGNGGGLIHAAERLLQILTPREIEPQSAQFVNTTLNLRVCRAHAPSTVYAGFTLEPWIESLERSIKTGSTYSQGFPITEREWCNDIGQKYYGPVLLITDALCYSATDMFAAGFQDHKIGPVLGVSNNTGAGGANVWSHHVLSELMAKEPDSPYAPLPHGTDMRTAVRRTLRVGDNAGEVIEDLGVEPDAEHRMTRDDLLHGNRDLLQRAAEILAAQKTHPIVVNFEDVEGGRLPRVRAKTRNVSRLDIYLDGRPQRSVNVVGDETVVDLQEAAGGGDRPRELLLHGYDGSELAVAYHAQIPEA